MLEEIKKIEEEISKHQIIIDKLRDDIEKIRSQCSHTERTEYYMDTTICTKCKKIFY